MKTGSLLVVIQFRRIQIPMGAQKAQSSKGEAASTKKRRREEESYKEYEKEAALQELQRAQGSGQSMLNFNLRNCYKDVQLEWDIVIRKKAGGRL